TRQPKLQTNQVINSRSISNNSLFYIIIPANYNTNKKEAQIEEKVHFGQFSSIFFLYVENKKLSKTPNYQCF
ncbi:TPA: hypothetical protein ACHVEO_001096, partial [Streptococcus suis]